MNQPSGRIEIKVQKMNGKSVKMENEQTPSGHVNITQNQLSSKKRSLHLNKQPTKDDADLD